MRIGRGVGTVALGVAILAVGAAGIASAADGNSVVDGKRNISIHTTSLRSTTGPALALRSPGGSPSLTVTSRKQVQRLNASYLDGLSAAQIVAQAHAGGDSQIRVAIGDMSGGIGIAYCPAGTLPIGGGLVPDPTGTSDTDIPFVVASTPHLTNEQLDGWEGIAADFDGTYNGLGEVFVSCSSAVTQSSAVQAKLMRRDARLAERAAR